MKKHLIDKAKTEISYPHGLKEGEMFEAEFFGAPTRFFNELLPELLDVALAQAKRLQSSEFQWDPRAPSTEFARRLFEAVKAQLPKKMAQHLRFYVAAGTPLDLLGIDCFFTLPFHRTVTVDLKLHSESRKIKWWRMRKKLLTDVIVSRDEMCDQRMLTKVAQEIVDCFKREPLIPVSGSISRQVRSSSALLRFRKMLGLEEL